MIVYLDLFIFHNFTCSTCHVFCPHFHRYLPMRSASFVSLVSCLSFSSKLHLSIQKLTKLKTYHLRYFVFKVMIENFTRSDKKIFDIFTRLRWCFKVELDAFFSLECLHSVVWDLSLVFHVFFVSHEHHNNGWFALGHDLVVPGGEVLKGV